MDLALVTGRGPDLLTNLGGLKPLVQDCDVVAFGFRDDLDGYGELAAESSHPAFQWVSLVDVRRVGASSAARDAIAHLRSSVIHGLWIHLDVDVLDDVLMPAVDSRQPGGLSYEELRAVLNTVLDSGLAVGLEITILDPELDTDGRITREFAGFLADTLSTGIVTRRPA